MSLVSIVLATTSLLILLLLLLIDAAVEGSMCGCERRFPVLMDLYHATNGTDWQLLSGGGTTTNTWGTTTTPCSVDWTGVTCDGSDVTALMMAAFGLQGTLPPSLGNLTGLRSFSVSYNDQLTGTLPASFAGMTSLVMFSAQQCQLTGTLPAEWAMLRKLSSLYLTSNVLHGTLPSEWGTTMEALTVLDVTNNQIAGPLPAQWKGLKETLKGLFLANNSINGSLPMEWSELQKVTDLELSFNALTGPLPEEWSQLASMQSLSLANNHIHGTLPPTWAGGFGQVDSLFLGNNSIAGTLPDTWWQYSSITLLDLQGNQLVGTLPSGWAPLTLKTLQLSRNVLNGTLPASWSSLEFITSLYLDGNDFTGSLPESWGDISTLEILDLTNNRLKGTLPDSWSGLTSMSILRLGNNQLEGQLPVAWGLPFGSCIADNFFFSLLDISGNCLRGIVPWNRIIPNIPILVINNCRTHVAYVNVSSARYVSMLCNSTGINDDVMMRWPQYCASRTATHSRSPSLSLRHEEDSKTKPQPQLLVRSNSVSPSSLSRSFSMVDDDPPRSDDHINPNTVFTAMKSANTAVVMSALVTSTSSTAAVARGAVPALQRASTALRFYELCHNAVAAGGAADDDNDGPMFSSFEENPLRIHFGVGGGNSVDAASTQVDDEAVAEDYAAGAAVGNSLMVVIIGGLSHVIGLARIRWRSKSSDASPRVSHAFLTVLSAVVPSSLLPGGLALPYNSLVQPTVSACIVLIMTKMNASAGALSIGVIALTLWVALPFYFASEVLWNARRLSTVSSTTKQKRNANIHCCSCFTSTRRSFPFRTQRLISSPIRSSKGGGERDLGLRNIISQSKWFVFFLIPTEVWVHPSHHQRAMYAASSSNNNNHQGMRMTMKRLYERIEPLIEPYVGHREWYFLVEWSVSIVSGLMLGIAQVIATDDDNNSSGDDARRKNACVAAQLAAWSGVVFGVLQVGLTLALWPMQIRLEIIVVVVVCTLITVSQLVLALADGSSSSAAAAAGIILCATVVELTAMGLTLLREIFFFVGKRRSASSSAAGLLMMQRDEISTEAAVSHHRRSRNGGGDDHNGVVAQPLLVLGCSEVEVNNKRHQQRWATTTAKTDATLKLLLAMICDTVEQSN